MPDLLSSRHLALGLRDFLLVCLALMASGCAGGGGYSGSGAGGGSNPTPAISSLSPASAAAGSGAQTLTINGSGFMSSSTVTFNGAAHAAMYVSSMQLTISLSAGDQATAGSYAVVVTNPAPGGGLSNSVNFTVNPNPNPMPAITSLTPSSATKGTAAQTLTINGTGFMSTSAVTFNGTVRAATFLGATQLTIQLSAADQATEGNYPVMVTNPAPGGGTSNTVTFPVVALIPPGAATVLILGGQSTPSSALNSAEIFASGTFGAAGGMLVARYRPTASLIGSGTTVLITGGADTTGGALSTAETFQVATKTFGAVTLGMKCAHKGHTATVLQDGRVLIAGRDGAIACAELYDPGTQAFTRTGDMKVLASDRAAVLLPSGKVLIVGGSIDGGGCISCRATASAELYDPTTGTFTSTAQSLTSARTGATATLLPSGKVLIAGGGTTPTSGMLTTAELYDPATDSFASAGSMTAAREYHSATLLPSGQVLIAGGLSVGQAATMTAELYDPLAGTFSATGAMSSARLLHTATPIGGGLVLVAGGASGLSGGGASSAELYDAASGVFTLTGSLATGRSGAAASPLQ